MNTYCIDKIISEEDCTYEYEKIFGRKPEFPCIKVVIECECCGMCGEITEYFLKPDWELAKKKGFYTK